MNQNGYSGNQNASLSAGRGFGRDGSVFSATGGYTPNHQYIEQSLRDIFDDLHGAVTGELRRFTENLKETDRPSHDK